MFENVGKDVAEIDGVYKAAYIVDPDGLFEVVEFDLTVELFEAVDIVETDGLVEAV